jgi:hypothetical protein
MPCHLNTAGRSSQRVERRQGHPALSGSDRLNHSFTVFHVTAGPRLLKYNHPSIFLQARRLGEKKQANE